MGLILTMASAAMPFPLPILPSRSVVVALMLTDSTAIPRVSAILCRMAGIKGANLGF